MKTNIKFESNGRNCEAIKCDTYWIIEIDGEIVLDCIAQCEIKESIEWVKECLTENKNYNFGGEF